MLFVEKRFSRKKKFTNPLFNLFLFLFNSFLSFFETSSLLANQIFLRFSRAVRSLGSFLRHSLLFKLWSLTDLFGSDYPNRFKRFRVLYRFRRLLYSKAFLGNFSFFPSWEKISLLSVNCQVKDRSPIPSLTSVYKSRSWFERECWDLYGVYFFDNPDLRRILTDYGFGGFPLRKDFPLSGYTQSRYDFDVKKVSYEAVNFRFGQSYRYFEFKSPWEKKKKRLFLRKKKVKLFPLRNDVFDVSKILP